MKTWFMSDPHFRHKRIIELCNRPFDSVEEMDRAIVDNVNSTSGLDKGRLVITGDICMGDMDESLALLGQLNVAELVLLPGNHDRWSLAFHGPKDPEAAAKKRRDWMMRYANSGPERTLTRVLEDTKPSYWQWRNIAPDENPAMHPLSGALFSHYPYSGESDWKRDDRYDFLRAPDDGLPIIHGHVHEQWKVKGRQFNVGVDVNEFSPVSEDELVEWMETL